MDRYGGLYFYLDLTKMKAFALAALAVSATAQATPALPGSYVEAQHQFKGCRDDHRKAVHHGRLVSQLTNVCLFPCCL